MYTITGSAFLLIPHESTILNADKKAPSLIYYHGHGTRRTKSAFDVNNYTRGIGFKAALAGFIVLVPTVRSMEVWDDHASYTRELHKEGKSILAQAALDTAHLQTMLELDSMQKSYNYKIDPGANAVAGVSFGGQVAHLAGALDDRFEIVSTHGTYYGFEVINSDAHHRCQHLHDIEGVANIFDISMLIPPRILHVGIGDNDKFYNDFSVTAINRLTTNYKTAGLTICKGDQHDHGKGLDVGVDLPLYTSTNDKCELILDVVDDAGHEFVSEELFFQKLYHKITQN